MAFCSNCGKEIKQTYKYCPSCGIKIEINNSEDLYEKVKKYVIENNKVSISLIQKEFKISSVKANNMIKQLEKDGVVGPANGRKGREVLTKKKVEYKNSFKDVLSMNVDGKIKGFFHKIMNTPDTTADYEKEDIDNNIFLAMLSYIGIFAFIPYFVHSDSKFVKYHAIQGINLLIIDVIYTLTDYFLSLIKVNKVVIDYGSYVGTKLVTPLWISVPMAIIGLILTLIAVTGIVNVCKGKAKELPIINKIKIVK